MTDGLRQAMEVVIVAQSALIVTQVLTRPKRLVSYYAIMAFFLSIVGTELPALIWEHYQDGLPAWFWLVTMGTWLLCPLLTMPALWLYTTRLTDEHPRPWQAGFGWHLLPFGFGLIGFLPFIFLHSESRRAIMLELPLTGNAEIVTLVLSLIDLAFIVSVIAYVPAILWRLQVYRKRLRDVFASTDQRELGWLSGLAMTMIAYLLSVLYNTWGDLTDGPMLPDLLDESIDLAVVWILCIWGLRQRPGFEGVDLAEVEDEKTPPLLEEWPSSEVAEAPSRGKYEKSALSPEQSARIAARLETAMEKMKLFRDEMLSLAMVARELKVSTNYLSQTLNETLGQTFFEYVNGWRIREAQHLLTTTDETVLTIATETGFNSRSSFYKAFQKQAGQTPTAYRKQMRSTLNEKREA